MLFVPLSPGFLGSISLFCACFYTYGNLNSVFGFAEFKRAFSRTQRSNVLLANEITDFPPCYRLPRLSFILIQAHSLESNRMNCHVNWKRVKMGNATDVTYHPTHTYSKCKIVATIGKIAFFGYTEKYCINIDFITDPTFYRAFGDFLEFNEWNKAFSIPSTYISLVLA